MDGVKLDGQELWMCKKNGSHALGVVQRMSVSNNGQKIHFSQLLKFRNAIDMNAERPIEVEVDCEIEGTTRVFCNVPGCVDEEGHRTIRVWHMDRRLVAVLLAPLYSKP